MTTDPGLVDILRELQNQSRELVTIREGITAQNSWMSFLSRHGWDFIVIFLADVAAAVVVLVTFESWKERDRQHTERAQRVLTKIGPHMTPLIQFLEQMATNVSSTQYATPWSSQRSKLGEDFSDSSLLPGSLDWQYPGGAELLAGFVTMRQLMTRAGATMASGSYSSTPALLEAARKVESLRQRQFETYGSGKTRKTWVRFFWFERFRRSHSK